MAQRHIHLYDSELDGRAGFEALLKGKTLANGDDRSSEDWAQKRREEWLSYLEILYKQIRFAVEPYVADKRVSIRLRDLTLVEEGVGEYTAQTMLIKFGHTEIALEPVGTMVLAAKGRLDVIGPFGKTPLLLVNAKARRLSDVAQRSTRIKGEWVIFPPESNSWEWRAVSKNLERELIPLNDEVILGILTEVANG